MLSAHVCYFQPVLICLLSDEYKYISVAGTYLDEIQYLMSEYEYECIYIGIMKVPEYIFQYAMRFWT